ncbi:MAG: hypothetical protein JWM68_2716 [Verrucomicrobiales bacterium]|nr:hypothetical protein [Verrucomicrobiales bacterium]
MNKRFYSFGLVLWFTAITSITAQTGNPWTSLKQLPDRAAADVWVRPQKSHAVHLDDVAFKAILARAPMEVLGAREQNPTEVSLPMPDGSLAKFRIVESPVMEPTLAAKFPEIKTYRGEGIDDPSASVRLDVTPAGFHAQILSPNGAVYIDPAFRHDVKTHLSYYKRDYRKGADGFQCLVAGPDQPAPANLARTELLRSGSQLRTYRLACAATGEYVQFHGGTVAAGMAAIVTAVNRVDGVYESEVAVRMVLVANNNLIVYTNASTDPYSNDNGSTMLGQNQTTVDSRIGSANYDIGHVFSTGGGGVAYLGSVCGNSKAGGVTGLTAPTGDAFYIDYVAHEMGHQFGGNHTFNSIQSNCGGGNRNASTAYEVGSGTTIMAYAGICGADDVQLHSDPYFHSISFDEILNYTTAAGGNGCAVVTATTNNAPTVSAGSNYTIPARTPFTLTATGSDPNGDPLTYCWEERDLGASQLLTDADNAASPLFRSFNPTTSPSRTFPQLSNILNNTSVLGEKLPTTTRTMTFRVTGRDNRSGGGGINTSDMQVSVSSVAGPFVVTAPNTGVTWSGMRTVTWSVAGTASSPVNAANVNIRLSTDGGLTFPIVLATNVPNNGSRTVTLPNIANSSARIKVEAAGNIFFDVSDVNFSITTFTPTPLIVADTATVVSEGCTPTNNAVDPGETVTVNFALKNVGTANGTNISATLLSGGGVNSPSGAQTYGAVVANGSPVAKSFSFLASGTCGGNVAAVFQIFDGATLLGTTTNFVHLGAVTIMTVTNSNTAQILIPASGNSGIASPFPSAISVSGLSGTISKVVVKLSGLAHSNPDDIDALLVAPGGQTVLLMSDAGGSSAISAVNLTFDDTAAASLADATQIVSGTYLPSNYGAGDTFSSPAPGGAYGSSLSALTGATPNGTWSLYITDDGGGNTKGSIASGWSIIITSTESTCCTFNSAPTLSTINDQTINEDVSTGSIGITVNDAETAPGSLNLTASSSNTNVVTNSRLVLGGTGANRTLSITPNTNQFGTSTITVSVSDGVLANSTAFLLTVNSLNDAPVLAAVSNRTIVEGTTVLITNSATDVDTVLNQLTFALATNAPGGATINSNTGVFSWTPTEAQGPSTNSISIIVSDNGAPSLSDIKTFSVVVTESNSAPVLAVISNQNIVEGATLVVTNTGTDADIPANPLTYSLATNAPVGASINPATGVFTWTPTEAQGPSTNVITVILADNGSPNLTNTKTFSVFVVETNAAPVLSAITNRVIHSGTTLVLTNAATDSDLPANALTFSFASTPPLGATIGATNGVLVWTPSDSQIGTNGFAINVTDNGSPNLSNQKAFTVSVMPTPLLSISSVTATNVTLSWSAIIGVKYVLQTKTNLNDVLWANLTNITAGSASASAIDPLGSTEKFYRVQLP